MNVNELMSREPRAVRMTDRLDAAARVLWEQDCGIVPVVDASNVVVGVLTDRDLCMAIYTQGRTLSDLPVAAAMARAVRSCRPDDSVATAMATMQQLQVHRLPVVDIRGVLVGMLSTNDLIRMSHARPAAVEAGSIVKLLATIGAPRRAVASATATSTKAASAMAPASKPGVSAVAEAAPAASSASSGTASKSSGGVKPAADPILPPTNKATTAASKSKPGTGSAKAKPKGRKA